MRDVLTVKGLSFSYKGRGQSRHTVVDNLSFKVSQGEIVSLVGPSGCGKTTILKLISGLLNPDDGIISLRGGPVADAARNGLLNYAPQQMVLLPHLTVEGNVLLPLRVNNRFRTADELGKLLKTMGLDEITNLYPDQLSRGMGQRVATARALVTNPELLMMDEPFASLDEFSREQINEDLLKWQVHNRSAIVFVTHNIPEAVFLSHRILVLSGPPAQLLVEIKIGAERRDQRFRESKAFSKFTSAVKKHVLQ